MVGGKLRVLFVDDEENMLKALRRSLRLRSDAWEVTFEVGGRQALRAIAQACFDVVVSDMRMPEIDGASLLEAARNACPSGIRLVLSGMSEEHALIRAVRCAHQYISKPCDAAELSRRLIELGDATQQLQNHTVREVVLRLSCIPSLPAVCDQVSELLNCKSCSLGSVAAFIRDDIGMTLKTLQIANSSFFGAGLGTTELTTALELIGHERLRALANNQALYQRASQPREIMLLEQLPALHELSCEKRSETIGSLLLALGCPDKWDQITLRLNNTTQHPVEIEKEILKTTSAQVGAYLLNVWGIPKDFWMEAA
ncbi:MAG: HDOD domain-containing protein [Oligoflexia bacterium]|nr:HDOD domain-containing protein [Oligoflexia bacterium]